MNAVEVLKDLALKLVRNINNELFPSEPHSGDYDIALRSDELDDDPMVMDDVVVHNVLCFHAEMMSDTDLWMACTLDKDWDEIVFNVGIREGRLVFQVLDFPAGQYVYEND